MPLFTGAVHPPVDSSWAQNRTCGRIGIWFAAGAVGVGFGAALVGGAGVAHADEAAAGPGSVSKASGSTSAGKKATGAATRSNSAPAHRILNASPAVAKPSDVTDLVSSSAVNAKVLSLSVSPTAQPARRGITASTRTVARLEPQMAVAIPQLADEGSFEGRRGPVQTAAAGASAGDAYLQMFRDADPTDRFYTPASSDWVEPGGRLIGIDELVQTWGTSGFGRNTDGSLTYVNRTSVDVAVEYALSVDSSRIDGIHVLAPGGSVVLPGGSSTFAFAQGPKIYRADGYTGYYLAAAGPGYPPNGPFKVYQSTNTFIAGFNSVINSTEYDRFMSLAGDISSILGVKLLGDVVNTAGAFVNGYKGDFFGAGMTAIQAVGDGLMAIGAKSKIGLLYAAGAAVSTIGYVADLAHKADWSDPGSTVSYAISHPAETVVEFSKATQQVLTHVGATVIGSLGGFFGVK